ncbi:hypothetical protein EVAR_48898_1 [Eumeta japonica]|uniref:Uncharacterized protein n=1 Tax=Eumeta variegata TaxID=151549 RepID=A0A4C1YYM0_EUMVA|nr:hypothetical protein EVAR_48898_1 [Eumeta japonica]
MSTKSQSRTEEVAASHIKKAQTPAENFTVEDGRTQTVRNTKVKEWEQASCPSSPQEIEEGSILPTISALSEKAERTKHAQELVRIERAHNKDLTNVVKTLTEELSQAREDVRKSLDETKSIRDWLGYETEENKETNKDVKKRLLDIETSLREIKMEKSKTKVESVTPSTKKMETDIKTLSAQLEELRTKWGALKNETSKTLETSNKTLHEIKNLPKQLSANEKVEEQLKAVQSAVENVSERLNSARDPVTPPTPGRNLERELAEAHTNPKPSYAEAAAKSPTPQPNHTLIVSSKDKTHTGEHVLQIIREAIDTKKSGAKVERVRKARNQKVILKCSTKEDMEAIQNKMRSRKEIKVEAAKAANPLLIMKGVMAYHKDADIIENVLAQNKHLVKDINLKEVTIRVRYRKRARNQLQCHPVLELSPSVHKDS